MDRIILKTVIERDKDRKTEKIKINSRRQRDKETERKIQAERKTTT
jgi:hypothetical protein